MNSPFRTPEPPTMPKSRFYLIQHRILPNVAFMPDDGAIIMLVLAICTSAAFFGWGFCRVFFHGVALLAFWGLVFALLFVRRGVLPEA